MEWHILGTLDCPGAAYESTLGIYLFRSLIVVGTKMTEKQIKISMYALSNRFITQIDT